MAYAPGEPADGARHGQSHLATPLWTRDRGNAIEFWTARRQADTSGVARLAGGILCRIGLVDQGDAPVDRVVEDLPAGVGCRFAIQFGIERPVQSQVLALRPPAVGCRVDSRRDVDGRRRSGLSAAGAAPVSAGRGLALDAASTI